MGAKTGIEWTGSTWNPVVGCEKVSQGCKRCYAKTLHDMRHKAFLEGKAVPPQYAVPFEMVQLKPERVDLPLHWKKPRMIFVDSVSDLFHGDVPFDFIDDVFKTMRAAYWHTFQVLTKRVGRAVDWFARYTYAWPDNVWMGASVEDQTMANKRVPLLLEIPSKVHFLSCEPLLEAVDLTRIPYAPEGLVLASTFTTPRFIDGLRGYHDQIDRKVDWVICGGESGEGARPMHPDWARSLREQCAEASVPFFHKQNGEWLHQSQMTQAQFKWLTGKQFHTWPDGSGSLWVGKQAAGHLLDGAEWRQMPILQVAG